MNAYPEVHKKTDIHIASTLFSHKELKNKRGRQRLTIGNALLLFYKKIETSKRLSPLKSHSFVLYRYISIYFTLFIILYRSEDDRSTISLVIIVPFGISLVSFFSEIR